VLNNTSFTNLRATTKQSYR